MYYTKEEAIARCKLIKEMRIVLRKYSVSDCTAPPMYVIAKPEAGCVLGAVVVFRNY